MTTFSFSRLLIVLLLTVSLVEGRVGTLDGGRKLVEPHEAATPIDRQYIVTFAADRSTAADFETFRVLSESYGAAITFEYKMVFAGVALTNVTPELLQTLETNPMVEHIEQVSVLLLLISPCWISEERGVFLPGHPYIF